MFSDWGSLDTASLLAALGAIYLDVDSTKYGLKHGQREANPFIGEPKPSGQTLDKYGLASATLLTLVAGLLDKQERVPLLQGAAGYEAGLAYNNYQGGKASSGLSTIPTSLGISGAVLGKLLTEDTQKIGLGQAFGAPTLAYTRKF